MPAHEPYVDWFEQLDFVDANLKGLPARMRETYNHAWKSQIFALELKESEVDQVALWLNAIKLSPHNVTIRVKSGPRRLTMELRHLRYFVKSAELLHFTRAADALHVSQPTLSIQIQELEQELGAALFERIGRTVRLTPAGKLFLSTAQRVLSQIEAGQQCLYDVKGLLRGTLRIGATAPFGAELLPAVVSEFLTLYPGMQVVLTKAATHVIEHGLKSRLLDLGLVYRNTETSDDFASRELCKVEIVAVLSREHVLSKSRVLHIRNFENVSLALPTTDFATRQVADAAFKAAKIAPKVVLETNDVEALFEVVRHGIAATLLPRQVAAKNKDLAKIRIAESRLFQQTAAFIWLREVRLAPAPQRFLELAEALPKRARQRRSRARSLR